MRYSRATWREGEASSSAFAGSHSFLSHRPDKKPGELVGQELSDPAAPPSPLPVSALRRRSSPVPPPQEGEAAPLFSVSPTPVTGNPPPPAPPPPLGAQASPSSQKADDWKLSATRKTGESSGQQEAPLPSGWFAPSKSPITSKIPSSSAQYIIQLGEHFY